MDGFVRDITQTFRLLSSNRGFTGAVLITIALGVGGTAAVFSVVYGVLLRPLPYPEPGRLVRMWEVHPGGQAPIAGSQLSGPTYRAWSRSSESLQDIGAFRGSDYTVTSSGRGPATSRHEGHPVRVPGCCVCRPPPAVSSVKRTPRRAPSPWSCSRTASGATALAADPAVIGTALRIDGVDHRIIGVAPPGFAFPEKEVGLRDDRREVTLYTPFAVRPRGPEAKVIDTAEAIARLEPGVTIAQAEAEGISYARSVERPLAELVFGKGNPVEVRVRSLVDQMTMACAAGAGGAGGGRHARAADRVCERRQPVSVARQRSGPRACGPRRAWRGPARLMRQLLTESLVIALLGGTLGVLVGWAMTCRRARSRAGGLPAPRRDPGRRRVSRRGRAGRRVRRRSLGGHASVQGLACRSRRIDAGRRRAKRGHAGRTHAPGPPRGRGRAGGRAPGRRRAARAKLRRARPGGCRV